MAGPVPETDIRRMTDRILIFSDHTGSERFFLRFAGTADEFQIWLERRADWSKKDTDWASITWEHCG